MWDLISPPFAISRTCQLWRAIALNTPELWTNIQLGSKVHSVRNLQLVLDRTRGRDLWIELSALYGPEDPPLPYFGGIQNVRCLDLLVSYAPYWRSLRVSERLVGNPALLALRSSDLSRLRFLVWTLGPRSLTDPVTAKSYAHLWNLTAAVSTLRSIRLGRIPPAAPWSGLIRLSITDVGLAECSAVLDKCARLVSLTLMPPAKYKNENMQAMFLPRLMTLRICLHDSSGGAFFNTLQAPALSHLEVNAVHEHNILTRIERMVIRSNAYLHAFILRGSVVPEETVIQFLTGGFLQDLRHLAIPGVPAEQGLWEVLQCHALGRMVTVPKLDVLEIGVSPHAKSTLVLEACLQRLQGNGPEGLTEVVLQMHNGREESDYIPSRHTMGHPEPGLTSRLADQLSLSIIEYDWSVTWFQDVD